MPRSTETKDQVGTLLPDRRSGAADGTEPGARASRKGSVGKDDVEPIDSEPRVTAADRSIDRSREADGATSCQKVLRVSGTIVQFNHIRGYGFIEQDDGSADVFLHWAELHESGLTAHVGARVSFTVVRGRRGLKACDVQALTAPPVSASGLAQNVGTNVERLSTLAYADFVTNILVEVSMTITAAQMIDITQRLVVHAYQQGWLVDRANNPSDRTGYQR